LGSRRPLPRDFRWLTQVQAADISTLSGRASVTPEARLRLGPPVQIGAMPASDLEFKGEIGRGISFTTPASVTRRDL